MYSTMSETGIGNISLKSLYSLARKNDIIGVTFASYKDVTHL